MVIFSRVATAQYVCCVPLNCIFPNHSEEKGGNTLSRLSIREGELLDYYYKIVLN
jgi:hypothetical protein